FQLGGHGDDGSRAIGAPTRRRGQPRRLPILGPGRDPTRARTCRANRPRHRDAPRKPSGISMRELERELTHDAPLEAGESALPPLAVIGAGRAGGAIVGAARRAGLRVELAGRERALEACRAAEAALLCVPDA